VHDGRGEKGGLGSLNPWECKSDTDLVNHMAMEDITIRELILFEKN
jgi:hypothetical protein